MSTSNPATPAPVGASKPLWAAIGALSVVVLAMGATLVHLQTQTKDPIAASPVASAQPTTTPAAPPAALPTPSVQKTEEIIAATPRPASKPKRPTEPQLTAKNARAGQGHHAAVAPPPDTVATSAVGATPAGEHGQVIHSGYPPVANVPSSPPSAVLAATKPLCLNCGTVETMTPVQREGESSGTGAVAGGVLGAIVGNQFGGGDGKTITTILGAIGGGMAGNAVEKKMKKETAYLMRIRMEDGSIRAIEQATPLGVGTRVTVNGNSAQPAALSGSST